MLPLLILVYLGGIPLAAGAFLVGLIGMWELIGGFRHIEVQPSFPIAAGFLCLLYVAYLVCLLFDFPFLPDYLILWLVLAVMASGIYLFDQEKRKIEDALATMLALIYVGFFSFHVVLTEAESPTPLFVWLIFLSAFGADIFAYFSGYFFGKHKLCPHLSPKKTVEGALGGILGAVALGGVFSLCFIPELSGHVLLLSLIASVASMFGDLTASAYKRKMGIKDYGNLIPGHGGIMDRFDSVLFTAPVVYYYSVLFIHG